MATCTWICHPNCDGEHHPLLIALFNTVDTDSLIHFTGTLRSLQVTGFNLEMKIPDPNPTFHHPLIHWAAALGKGDVLKILQKPPFSMDMAFQSDDFETALHRSLVLWNAKEIPLNNVFSVIEQLRECLDIRNARLQTPLHICAINLTKCVKQDFIFWKEVMNNMVTSIDDSKLEMVLNSQDVNGDSILHILSTNGDLLDVIHSLLCCGANLDIQNYRKEKPVDIACQYSIAVYNLYRAINNEIGLGEFYANINVSHTRTATGLSKTRDYKRFFNTSDKSDDDDHIIVKRKVSPRSASVPKKTNQCKKKVRRVLQGPEKSSSKNYHKLDREQKSCSLEAVQKTKRVDINVSDNNDDPPPTPSSPCFNQAYVKANLQDEMRLEEEINETMKSIVIFQDEATAKC